MGYTNQQIYCINVGNVSMSPADSTTYYFGNIVQNWGSTANVRGFYVPVTGVIKAVYYRMSAVTATGTNEDMVLLLRKNNTTDYTIATVGAASAVRDFNNTALAIPVNAGDFIEFKMTTPAWVTNPEGIYSWGLIEILI